MKFRQSTALWTSLILILGASTTYGQGKIVFTNRTPSGDAPVTLSSGAGPGDLATAGLFLVGEGSLQLIATTGFRTSSGRPDLLFPVIATVPGIPSGSTATFRTRVWETSAGSYEGALATGGLHGEFQTIHGNYEVSVILGDERFSLPSLDGILPLTLIPEPKPSLLAAIALLGVFPLVRTRRRPATANVF